tara:strand:- start:7586 stop:8704 length:1119 start_codon:yes stop_codon:yes gene_type:complete
MEITILAINNKHGGGLRVLRQIGDAFLQNGNNVNYIFSKKTDSPFFSKTKAKCFYPLNFYRENYIFTYFSIFFTVFYCRAFFSKSKIIVSDPFFMPFIWLLLGCNVYRFSQADDHKLFEMNFKIRSGKLFSLYDNIFKFFECLGSYFPYKKIYFSSKALLNSFKNRYRSNNVSNRISRQIINPCVENIFFKDSIKPWFNKEKIVIGTILRSHPSKRAIDFIDMVKKLDHKRYIFKAIVFKDEVNLIRKNILDFQSNQSIEIQTSRNDDELSNFYLSLDIYISTSEFDGFGLPALEAMASGKIAVIAKNQGIINYANDEINSLIFEPRNVKQLIDKILKIEREDVLRKKISSNAYKTAKEFSIENLSKILKSF